MSWLQLFRFRRNNRDAASSDAKASQTPAYLLQSSVVPRERDDWDEDDEFMHFLAKKQQQILIAQMNKGNIIPTLPSMTPPHATCKDIERSQAQQGPESAGKAADILIVSSCSVGADEVEAPQNQQKLDGQGTKNMAACPQASNRAECDDDILDMLSNCRSFLDHEMTEGIKKQKMQRKQAKEEKCLSTMLYNKRKKEFNAKPTVKLSEAQQIARFREHKVFLHRRQYELEKKMEAEMYFAMEKLKAHDQQGAVAHIHQKLVCQCRRVMVDHILQTIDELIGFKMDFYDWSEGSPLKNCKTVDKLEARIQKIVQLDAQEFCSEIAGTRAIDDDEVLVEVERLYLGLHQKDSRTAKWSETHVFASDDGFQNKRKDEGSRYEGIEFPEQDALSGAVTAENSDEEEGKCRNISACIDLTFEALQSERRCQSSLPEGIDANLVHIDILHPPTLNSDMKITRPIGDELSRQHDLSQRSVSDPDALVGFVAELKTVSPALTLGPSILEHGEASMTFSAVNDHDSDAIQLPSANEEWEDVFFNKGVWHGLLYASPSGGVVLSTQRDLAGPHSFLKLRASVKFAQ